VDQLADLALATIGNGVAAIHDALPAGFDSSWSKNLPPIRYRHAERQHFLCIKSASSP